MTPTANGIFARSLVAHLAASGVTRFVLCPGSRSGPLAHVLAEAASREPPPGAPAIDLYVRIDERVAGFVALGLAKATGDPVVVVTTSGTAVGNLLPAVMEAHHSGERLIVVTADRPFSMRGTGANQTTDQRNLFGGFVQLSRDVLPPSEGRDLNGEAAALVAEALRYAAGVAPVGHPSRDTIGPVHLNLQFSPPLGPDFGAWPAGRPTVIELPPEAPVPNLPDLERGIVIAGDGAGPAAAAIASSHGWPLFAEPSSGARTGSACVEGYVEMLSRARVAPLMDETQLVLVIGRPTLSRSIAGVIADAPRLWVARFGARWREAPEHAEVVARDVPFEWVKGAVGRGSAPATDSWLGSWLELGREPMRFLWDSRTVAAGVVASVGPKDVLVLGSSGPIRAVDAILPTRRTLDMPRILANRGLAGIDGTISTAVGVALANVGSVTALVGDVTFLHDIGGLLVGTREFRPNLRIVVANDGGGTIFSGLEHAAAPSDRFERVFTTPHDANIASLASGFGARYVEARDGEVLTSALEEPPQGIEVIEAVLTPREKRSGSGLEYLLGLERD